MLPKHPFIEPYCEINRDVVTEPRRGKPHMGRFKETSCLRSTVTAIVIPLLIGTLPAAVAAEFTQYALAAQFDLPSGADLLDVLADGRIVALVGAQVYTETSPGSRQFSPLGTLPDADLPGFGAAFIRVSPDGTKMAVGNNGGASFGNFQVGVFDAGTLIGTWFTASHFDAAWYNDTQLALTAGAFGNPGVVTMLDTTSADPLNPANPVVIDNIGGASAGIAFDAAGNLYTGNGFTTSGPSGTGTVKFFDVGSWLAALSGGGVPDFEAGGTLIVDILSASPIGFDTSGNLFVGGGDFSFPNDVDFAAVVRASAVTDAVMGRGPADTHDPAWVARLDPDTSNDFNFYSINFNPVSDELYVHDLFSSPTVYVYKLVNVVPVPTSSTWGVAGVSILLVTVGTLTLRRRELTTQRWTGSDDSPEIHRPSLDHTEGVS